MSLQSGGRQPAFRGTGNTVNVSASASSGNVLVRSGQGTLGHVRVLNDTAVKAFVEFGADNTVVAALATSIPIPAGGCEILETPHSYAAVILPSGTGSVYFTPGEGL